MNKPAIHEDRHPGDIFGLVGGEENGSTDQIFRLANASPRDAFLPVFRLADVGDQVTCHRRFDEPRADGIDVNVIGASSTAVDFVSMMTPALDVL